MLVVNAHAGVPLCTVLCCFTVGEPINPEAWNWYNEVVGEKRCPIVDTWWQTGKNHAMIKPSALF